jgi:hypothetical protein
MTLRDAFALRRVRLTPGRSVLSSLALVALALAARPTLALAQGGPYEGAATFKAAEILPPVLVKGPRFQVKSDVPTTGYFHDFSIDSDYGDMEAEGRSLLRMRVHEIEALTRLDDVSKTEVFMKAAGTSVLNVGKGVASVVSDPGATAKGFGGGVKRFGTNLGRKAKRGAESAADSVKGDDKKDASQPEKSTTDKAADAGAGAARSVLGVNSAMRRWAQKLRVDPYTSNPVLRKALQDVAEIDAAGGIAAKVVVPVPTVVGTTASVGGLVWGKDPEELRKLNEQTVKALGTDPKAASEFFKNKAFGMGYQTRFLTALGAVKVPGCGSYVDTAEEAENERQVVFFTESAELLQRFHAKSPVAAILPDSRAVVAKTKDGRAVILLAVDYIRWSEAFEKSLQEIRERAKSELGASKLELQLTGFASAGAKAQLSKLGIALVERVPGTYPDPKPAAKAS